MLKNNFIEEICKNTGILLLGFIVMNAFICTLFFIIGLNITTLVFWIDIFVVLILYMIVYSKKQSVSYQYMVKWASVLLSTIIMISSIFVSSKIYDISYDGNYYHKSAIGLLKTGWNPLKQSADEFSIEIFKMPGNKIFKWIDHYQNVSWLFGAPIYAMTGNIESAKSINFIIMAGALLLSIYLLLRSKFSIVYSVVGSFVLIFSPIMLSQMLTFYVDGILSLMFFIYVAFLVKITYTWKNKTSIEKSDLIILFIVISILLNIKLTGLVMMVISTIPFFILWIKLYLENQKNKLLFKKIIIFFSVSLFFAMCITGGTSYVKNLFVKHNPFYPLVGSEKVDIISTMQPKSFKDKNQLEKLFVSIFSKSDNVTNNAESGPEFKKPLTWDLKEEESLMLPDTRIGGFGVFYSGIFIITVILSLTTIIMMIKRRQDPRLKNIIITFVLVISGCILYALLPTENWWARYAPNVYMITIACLIFTLIVKRFFKNIKSVKILNFLSTILLILVFANSAIFIKNRLRNMEINTIIKQDFAKMKKEFEEGLSTEILINEEFAGVLFNLYDLGFDNNANIKINGAPVDLSTIKEYKKIIYSGRVLYK